MPLKVITGCEIWMIQSTAYKFLIKQKDVNLLLAIKWGHQNNELWFLASKSMTAIARTWLFFVASKSANKILKPNNHYNTELQWITGFQLIAM